MASATYKDFEQASAWLSGAPAAASLPNDIKLELYGIFKSLTTRAGPVGSRPGFFNPTARAKYDAWAAQAALYAKAGPAVAQARYTTIARQVGWTGEHVEDDDEEIDFDEPDPAPRGSDGPSRSAGMGTRVSAMAMPDGAHSPAASSPRDIHAAVVEDRLADVHEMLQQDPGIIDTQDEYGNTPLHLACDRGHLDIVTFLLKAGADVDVKDEDGSTPIMLAKTCDRQEVIKALQAHGVT